MHGHGHGAVGGASGVSKHESCTLCIRYGEFYFVFWLVLSGFIERFDCFVEIGLSFVDSWEVTNGQCGSCVDDSECIVGLTHRVVFVHSEIGAGLDDFDESFFSRDGVDFKSDSSRFESESFTKPLSNRYFADEAVGWAAVAGCSLQEQT